MKTLSAFHKNFIKQFEYKCLKNILHLKENFYIRKESATKMCCEWKI